MRFRCAAPGAHSVSLVGAFNGWDAKRNPMRPTGAAGIWETEVSLTPGLWRYAFVVDGTWVRPADAPFYEKRDRGGARRPVTGTTSTPSKWMRDRRCVTDGPRPAAR